MTQEKTLFTLAVIKKSKEIITINKTLADYQEEAKNVVIATQENYKETSDFTKKIKGIYNDLENKSKFYSDPYYRTWKDIKAFFNKPMVALKAIEKISKDKMLTWYNTQEEIARKEQERIKKDNDKKIAKFEEKQAATPEKEITAPVINMVDVTMDKTARADNSTSTVIKTWKWKIQDEQKIPREYLCIDEKKLNRLVKAGLKDVPGIFIYSENSMTNR